jgi:hypothetical protein
MNEFKGNASKMHDSLDGPPGPPILGGETPP